MLKALVRAVRHRLEEWDRVRLPPRIAHPPAPVGPLVYRPLRRVLLTDEVSRTLFEEYRAHRAGHRGEEETGWVLMGARSENEALVLATLPAGAERNAGHAHVRFNSGAQALASRIVRQADRRLSLLGVVHTHPGRLRHPSDGDFRGDSLWVGQLRGREGVFGIGTADASIADGPEGPTVVAWQPNPHTQCLGELRLSWYELAEGERAYRPLSVELTLGPDLARPLRPVWPMIEEHADRLDRLARQLARVRFEVVEGREGAALALHLPLPDPDEAVRVLLEGKEVRYYLLREGATLAADLRDARVDQGVYLLLAELAASRD